MSIQKAHLRKLLRFFMFEQKDLRTYLKRDILEEKYKEQGIADGGMDFYTPFWSDAKEYAAGLIDLTEATDVRVAANKNRANLYPKLRDGFINWWEEKRRWSNQSFELIETPIKGEFELSGVDATVKVENLMCFKVGEDQKRLIYPYFSDWPVLNADYARLGLWGVQQALAMHENETFRILDVIRATSFSLDDYPFQGDEEDFFIREYKRILDYRTKLLDES